MKGCTLTSLSQKVDASSSVAFARPLLSEAHMRWTRSLPLTLRRLADDEVFACHGSPAGGGLGRMRG
jgi:hypothetical protein